MAWARRQWRLKEPPYPLNYQTHKDEEYPYLRILYHSLRAKESESPKALPRDFPTVPQVILGSLMDAVFPPLLPDLDAICQTVLSRMMVQKAEKYIWKCLPEDPVRNLANEVEDFRFVSQIFQGVQAITSPGNSGITITVAGDRSLFPFVPKARDQRPVSNFPTQPRRILQIGWILSFRWISN